MKREEGEAFAREHGLVFMETSGEIEDWKVNGVKHWHLLTIFELGVAKKCGALKTRQITILRINDLSKIDSLN